jgi:ATP sulfurylase
MKMASGLFWPIPITLSTDKANADTIKEGQDVALVDSESKEILATMKVTEKYTIDKAHECMMVYKTADLEHPGVKMVMEQGDTNLAGSIKVLSQGDFPKKYPDAFFNTSADPGNVHCQRLEYCCSISNPQSYAPVPRIPGENRGRNLRRSVGTFAVG